MTPAELRQSRYRALSDPVRRRILRLLEDSAEPRDVESLAGAVRLHPNTVRGHLDVLEAADLVARDKQPRTAPGRPRVVYRRTSGSGEPAAPDYRLLAEMLIATVESSTHDPALSAEEAGRRWARQLCGEIPPDALSSDEAARRITQLLEEVGFAPRAEAGGGRTVIELSDCPFRDVARDHPEVICSLHMGLMRGAAEALGNATEVESLEPFVQPSLCRTVLTPRV